jgi:hypothetical protein
MCIRRERSLNATACMAVAGALVADEDDASVGQELSGRTEDIDRVRHVVQGLEDRDQVVAAGEAGVCGVALVERDAVFDAGAGEVVAGARDRGSVGVDAVDEHLWVAPSDLDAGAALAAGDVGDACRWVGQQALVNLRRAG